MARVVIVIDMVRGFFDPKYNLYLGPACRRIVPNVRFLLESERKMGSRLLFLCDNHAPDDEEFKIFAPHCIRGTVETEVIPELAGFVDEYIPKTRSSAFYNSRLGERLNELRPETVVICGVCTDICVLHTAGDARDRDLNVEIPADCVTTFDLKAHQFCLEHMERVLGAHLVWATVVKPAKPDFRPPIAALFGETADIGLARSLEIIKAAGIDRSVTTEVSAGRAGTLCGMDQVRGLLEKVMSRERSEVWALEDGDDFQKGEIVLRITAPFKDYMLYETAYLGFLARCSGWAAAARECVGAARSVPVVNLGASSTYPTVAGFMEYSSVIGGCQHINTLTGATLAGMEATGALSASLFSTLGSQELALAALKQHALPKERLILPVGIWKGPAEESLSMARDLGGKLHAVKLSVQNQCRGVTPDLVKEVRASLNAAGFTEVLIFVSGDLTPDAIKGFLDSGAPVDYFGVEGYISNGPPISFQTAVCQVDSTLIARPGCYAGLTPNRRLRRVL